MSKQTAALQPLLTTTALKRTPAQLVPTPPRWRVTPEQKSVGHEVTTAAAVIQGTQIVEEAAAVAVGHIHQTTHEVYAETLLSILGRKNAVEDREARRYLDDFTADELAMLQTHQLAIAEAGAYQIGLEVNRSLRPQPAKPGFFRRLAGG